MTVSKEDLLKARVSGAHEVEVAGVGTVKVRALTRKEALQVRGKEFAADELERKLIALAMVEPKLTEDDVRAWQEVSPAGELQDVTDAIVALSGMEKAAAKAAYQQFRG